MICFIRSDMNAVDVYAAAVLDIYQSHRGNHLEFKIATVEELGGKAFWGVDVDPYEYSLGVCEGTYHNIRKVEVGHTYHGGSKYQNFLNEVAPVLLADFVSCLSTVYDLTCREIVSQAFSNISTGDQISLTIQNFYGKTPHPHQNLMDAIKFTREYLLLLLNRGVSAYKIQQILNVKLRDNDKPYLILDEPLEWQYCLDILKLEFRMLLYIAVKVNPTTWHIYAVESTKSPRSFYSNEHIRYTNIDRWGVYYVIVDNPKDIEAEVAHYCAAKLKHLEVNS